jgi:hypothetical protein
MKRAAKTLDNIVIVRRIRRRPAPSKILQNLCPDKGYNFQEIEYEAVKRGYIPHIRYRGEESLLVMTKKYNNHHPASRRCGL